MDSPQRERENIKATYGITDEQLSAIAEYARRTRVAGIPVSIHDFLNIIDRETPALNKLGIEINKKGFV